MAGKRTRAAASERLAGRYVFRFNGFDRDDSHPRYITGVGIIELNENGDVTMGQHRATNSPMAGRPAMGRGLKNSPYDLTGTYTIVDAGPPIKAEINIKFTRANGGNPNDLAEMWDTFQILQSGPDSFWLISSNPREEADPGSNKKIQELIIGEAVKVDDQTW